MLNLYVASCSKRTLSGGQKRSFAPGDPEDGHESRMRAGEPLILVVRQVQPTRYIPLSRLRE